MNQRTYLYSFNLNSAILTKSGLFLGLAEGYHLVHEKSVFKVFSISAQLGCYAISLDLKLLFVQFFIGFEQEKLILLGFHGFVLVNPEVHLGN